MSAMPLQLTSDLLGKLHESLTFYIEIINQSIQFRIRQSLTIGRGAYAVVKRTNRLAQLSVCRFKRFDIGSTVDHRIGHCRISHQVNDGKSYNLLAMRCVSCGQLQGLPHAGGCKFEKYTIRRFA